MPFSAAILRAIGEALTLPPATELTAAIGSVAVSFLANTESAGAGTSDCSDG